MLLSDSALEDDCLLIYCPLAWQTCDYANACNHCFFKK